MLATSSKRGNSNLISIDIIIGFQKIIQSNNKSFPKKVKSQSAKKKRLSCDM
jgi:hypothetical protein